MSTKNVLAALSESNAVVTLGLELAGEIIPLGKALVSDIRKISIGGKTYTYEQLIAADTAELDVVHGLVGDDLATANAELAKMGLPALLPEQPAPAPAAAQAAETAPAAPALGPTLVPPATPPAAPLAGDPGNLGEVGEAGDRGTNGTAKP